MLQKYLSGGLIACASLTFMACFSAGHADTLNAGSFTSAWEGEILWAGETAPQRAVVSLSNQKTNGAADLAAPLELTLDLGQAGCIGPTKETARVSGGRVIQLKPSGKTNCKAEVASIQLVATTSNEIGILVLGATNLLAQGKLKPRDVSQQLAIAPPTHPEFSPEALKGPSSLIGYFYVTPAGSVYELVPFEKDFGFKVVATSQFEGDAGVRPGELVGRGRYNSAALALSRSEKVKLSEETKAAYRHCPAIYTRPEIYDLIDLTDRSAVSVPDDVIALTPRSKQFCTRVRTSRESCRVTSCSEYTPHGEKKTFLVKDRALARKMGDAARASHTASETYAQAAARLKRDQAAENRARGTESKGYFDAGGACGPISCEQEDTLQFIMDQYWK